MIPYYIDLICTNIHILILLCIVIFFCKIYFFFLITLVFVKNVKPKKTQSDYTLKIKDPKNIVHCSLVILFS
jgi:hypothetical protein